MRYLLGYLEDPNDESQLFIVLAPLTPHTLGWLGRLRDELSLLHYLGVRELYADFRDCRLIELPRESVLASERLPEYVPGEYLLMTEQAVTELCLPAAEGVTPGITVDATGLAVEYSDSILWLPWSALPKE